MAGDSKRAGRREKRQTGTAGHATIPETETLPPDPQDLGRPMTEDERVDEASLQSMDGSDPPAHAVTRSGEPSRPEEEHPSRDERIRQRAYELWEREGRQPGRDEEYWQRAEAELFG